jgi:DNA (cytosine-5)-methyltransferase 1
MTTDNLLKSFRFGSLFSGIGGIDLGLERAGMQVAWQCEIDPYCRRVLAKHWPEIPCYEDVRNLPDDIEPVDLICGGYPCQPFSLAGTRKGGDDPRHLWPAYRDALCVLRPEWALLENVPGHLSLGFGDVLGDLDSLGYDTEWTCIPAAAVGAPHLRWRLFVVAHATCHQGRVSDRNGQDDVPDAKRLRVAADRRLRGGMPSSGYQSRRASVPAGAQVAQPAHLVSSGGGLADATGSGFQVFQGRPAFSERAGGGAAISAGWWDVEPDVGRVANGVPSRVDRLRGLGNAVVPQVAELIGRMILEAA